MPVAKEQIRQIIANNNLSSVADVYSLLRDSFKDILQELLEAELDASLGYEKIIKVISLHLTNVTGIPKRNSKASMGNSRSMSQGTAMVNLNQRLYPNTKGIYQELRKRYSPFMPVE